MEIKVLIVEDDPMVAQINSSYLKKTQGVVLAGVVNSVEEAKNFLCNHTAHIVLLDIFLGGDSGINLLKYIRSNNIPVEVIIVSAAKDKDHIFTAMSYGVCDYLVKPFSFTRFEKSLNLAKSRVLYLQKDIFDQRDLDNMIFTNKKNISENSLPKGLDKKTLINICGIILKHSEDFTINEIATTSNISRVTVKKYFDYLFQQSYIEEKVIYGSVGRPTLYYRIIPSSKAELEKILSPSSH